MQTEPTTPPPTIVPWWKTTKARAIAVLALVGFLGFAYAYDQLTQETELTEETTVTEETGSDGAAPAPTSSQSAQSSQSPVSSRSTPSKTVTDQTAFKVTPTTAGTCSVDRPEGWGAPVVVEGNLGADLASADKSMYAGNAIKAINTQLAAYAGYQPAPLNDADLYSEDPAVVTLAHAKIITGSLGGDAGLSFTGEVNEAVGDYQIRSVASSTHKGVIYYHRSGIPGDGFNYSYALPMTFALTTSNLWNSYGLMVARVAASIRCTATLVARAQSGPDLGGSESSSSAKDENGSDAGYNPQLGTEEVHDPDTGQNYVVSPSTNWSETGPQGPGYYAPKGGGDYVQLQPGRVD